MIPRWWRFNAVLSTSPGNAYTNVVDFLTAPPFSLFSVRLISLQLAVASALVDALFSNSPLSSTKLLTSCRIFRAISSPSLVSDASGAVDTFSLIRWISITTLRLLEKNFLLVENRAVRYFEFKLRIMRWMLQKFQIIMSLPWNIRRIPWAPWPILPNSSDEWTHRYHWLVSYE